MKIRVLFFLPLAASLCLWACVEQRGTVRTPVISADYDDDGYISDEEYDQFQKKTAIAEYNYQVQARAEEERRARSAENERQVLRAFQMMGIAADKSMTQSQKLNAMLNLYNQ